MGKATRIVVISLVAAAAFSGLAMVVGGGKHLADTSAAAYQEHVAIAPEGTTVAFYYGGCMSPSRFVGSGAVIGHRDGRTYVLTACHVVMGAPPSLNVDGLAVRVEKCSLEPDLALVSIPDVRGTAFSRAPYPRERFPVWIEAWFSGDGREEARPIVTMGIVCNQEAGWLDAAAMGGFSGGAVLDWRGHLVGTLIAGYVEWPATDGINICVTNAEVEAFLDGEGF